VLIPPLPAPWSDLLDVALVSALVYAVIVWMRGGRAHLALFGIGILGCVYLLAEQLGLTLMAWLFQAFFAVFLVMLVVVFQRELRQAFERIAVWGLRRTWTEEGSPDLVDTLATTASDLAAARRGALIVLPGRDPIERHVEGGIALSGRVSEPLLLSLFDPGSAGHDGAVIINGDDVERFAVHLPLSSNRQQLMRKGTRHAAALGLAERTDCLCLVVSEETGRISVARQGRLRHVSGASALAAELRSFLQPEAVHQERSWATPLRQLAGNWREFGAAVALSSVLWVLVVPGSDVAERIVRVGISVENLPEGYELESLDPQEVSATVSGLRRDLFLLDADQFHVVVDGFLVGLGRRTFELSPQSVRHPPELVVSDVSPGQLRLSIKKSAGGNGKSGGAGP
jgi:diadenylate cyclase